MLSISKCGSISYYLDLSEGDYYLQGGEPPGEWLGRGAGARDLSGEVARDSFEALARGFDPKTGKALVQNGGSARRQMGWDLAFSAPKSVSVAWALSERDVRRAIREAQARAVRVAVSFLESEAGLSRAGSGGGDVQRALWTGVAFEHGTSRAQDPQLHTHVVVLNLGLCPDGKTRALKTEELFQLKMTAGAVYRAELARELEQLGFAVERHSHHDPEKRRTHSWFELTAVPWVLAIARFLTIGYTKPSGEDIFTLEKHIKEEQRRVRDVPGRTGLLAERRRYSLFDEELIERYLPFDIPNVYFQRSEPASGSR